MRIRLAILLGAAAACGMMGSRAEEADVGTALAERVRAIFQRSAPAVVRVEAADRHGGLSGTGFFVDPMGTVFTAAAAVGDSSEATIVVKGQRIPAKVLATDRRSGLALLQANVSETFLPEGRSVGLHPATPVMAIGYPMDQGVSPTLGVVGGFHHKYQDRFFVTAHIWANMPVQNGFGGAPLLNLKGEVVGIIVAGLGGGASCFALPIEAAEKIRSDALRFGEARPGWVGVTVESGADGRVRVAELDPETPAAQSGLRAGDLLLQVGDVPIQNVEDILDASFFLTDGDFVTIRVSRNGHEMEYPVRAALHPSCGKNDLRADGIAGGHFELLTK